MTEKTTNIEVDVPFIPNRAERQHLRIAGIGGAALKVRRGEQVLVDENSEAHYVFLTPPSIINARRITIEDLQEHVSSRVV